MPSGGTKTGHPPRFRGSSGDKITPVSATKTGVTHRLTGQAAKWEAVLKYMAVLMTTGLHSCNPDVSSCKGVPATDEPVGRVRRVDSGGIRSVGGVRGPVWPIGIGANRRGGGRHDLVRGGQADILGHSARDLRRIWSHPAETSEHFEQRAGSGKKGHEMVKAGHPCRGRK